MTDLMLFFADAAMILGVFVVAGFVVWALPPVLVFLRAPLEFLAELIDEGRLK